MRQAKGLVGRLFFLPDMVGLLCLSEASACGKTAAIDGDNARFVGVWFVCWMLVLGQRRADGAIVSVDRHALTCVGVVEFP